MNITALSTLYPLTLHEATDKASRVGLNIIIITFYVCQCSISSLSHESTFCRPFCSSAGADMERSGTGWDEIYYSEMQVRLQNLY